MKLLKTFINGLVNPKTLKELIYLLLAMPLGIAYFVLLVVGFSLGAGLLILGVGILILAGLLALARVGGWLEALLAHHLLDADVRPSLDLHYDQNQPFFANVGRILTDGKAIRSLIFTGIKFPLGIFTFVMTVVAIALPLGLISAPLTYDTTNVNIQIGTFPIETPIAATVAMVFGIVLLPLSLMTIKGLSFAWRKLAEALLQPNTNVEKQKRKQKRDMSHLMDDTTFEDDYIIENGYEYDDESDNLESDVIALRQLLNS